MEITRVPRRPCFWGYRSFALINKSLGLFLDVFSSDIWFDPEKCKYKASKIQKRKDLDKDRVGIKVLCFAVQR